MRCEKHNDKEAVGFCVECGRGVCEDCVVKIGEKRYCKECEDKIMNKSTNKDEKYIVCENCGKYYELQNGEAIDDFESCECGGNLKSQGKIEKQTENSNEGSDLLEMSRNYLIDFEKNINWFAVMVGILVVFVISFLSAFFGSSFIIGPFLIDGSANILLALLSGLIAGYVVTRTDPLPGKNFRNGITHGIVSSFIATPLSMILIFWILIFIYFEVMGSLDPYSYYSLAAPDFNYNPNIFSELILAINIFSTYIWSVGYVIATIFFGALGGLLGTYIRLKRFSEKEIIPNRSK